jgi:hypothetical protein
MNAKEEFIKHIGSRSVLCAHIQKGDDYDDQPSVFNLTTGWDSEDWSKFLSDLNFEYDAGYGGQNLFGTIWYADGTWSDRGEYDGSEWYEYHICPTIPKELNRLDKVREQKLNQIL